METPTNYLMHVHDGYVYAYALDENELRQARAQNGVSFSFQVTDFDWSRAERVLPQVGVVVDPETGEQCGPDEIREAYIAALANVLRTTEPVPS